MMQDVEVSKVLDLEDLKLAWDIRHRVFVDEQGCPAHLERADEHHSHHFLARCGMEPCGAARWRQTEKGIKLERFAVLKAFRNRGVGEAMAKAVLKDIPMEAGPIYLNAQLPAVPFYSRLGFIPEGEEFVEAGFRHLLMVFDASRR